MRTRWILALMVLGGLVACSQSGSGGGAASTAAPATATPPGAVVFGPLPSLASGDVPIAYRLVDPSPRAVDISVQVSLDGGATWTVAGDGPGGDGRVGLSTGPQPGADHVWVWDSAADVTALVADVRLRIEAVGLASATSSPFPADNQPLSAQVALTREPYLQSTTQTSVWILWHTDVPTESLVEYGATPALGSVAGDPHASTRYHEVQLTQLAPGSDVAYRIVSGGQPVTPRAVLRTAPAPGAEVTFLAFGDSGTGRPEQWDLAAQLNTETADLVLHLGDVIYEYGAVLDPVGKYDERFFRPYAGLLRRTPVFPVTGNHDMLPALGVPYLAAFKLPENNPQQTELYYSFEWGDVKFVALESTLRFLVPVGPHMDWLRQELAGNTKKWLIVYLHNPLYSSRADPASTVLRYVLGPLFEHNGVDLVLNGHEHIFERTQPMADFNRAPGYPGIVHLTSGAAGRLKPVPTPRAPYSAVAISEMSYLRMTIRGDELHGECKDEKGQVLDTFLIRNQ